MEESRENHLERRVADWRRSMRACSSITAEDLDELESHLRDSVGHLRAGELSDDEAFLVAVRRVGSPSELDQQFVASRPAAHFRQKIRWLLGGILGYWMVGSIARTLSFAVLLIGSSGENSGVTLGYVALALQGLVLLAVGGLFAWYFRARSRQRDSHGGASRWSVGLETRTLPTLVLLCVAGSAFSWFFQMWAVRVCSPQVVGGFYLVAVPGWSVVSFVAVCGLGLVLSLEKSGRATLSRLASLICLIGVVGCKPGVASDAGPSATPPAPPVTQAAWIGPAKAGSGFERCLALHATDPAAAVDAFMKLDLGAGRLFVKGSTLGYSELEFMKLPRSTLEGLQERIHLELGAIKRLARDVKEKSDQARMGQENAEAERYTQQLGALGSKLQEPDQLKITQLVGQAIVKMAAR